MRSQLWKKLFLITLVLLFLLPGCGQKKEELVTVYCLKEIDYGTYKQEYKYDEAGNVLEYPHSGTGHTVCTYDENNNTLTSDYYLDSLIKSTVYTYDESGKMLTKTVTHESVIEEYTYTYDSHGNLASENMTASNLPYEKTIITYTYNQEDTLIQSVQSSYHGIDSDLSQTTIKTFDDKGNPLVLEHYVADNNIPSNKILWDYDDTGHCLSDTTYRDGELFVRKLYTYDAAGNLLAAQDDPEVPTDYFHRTEYTYDRRGNKLSEKEYFSFKGNREKLSQHFTYTYDKKGNLLEETQLSPEDGNMLSHIVWTYDKAGTIRSKSNTLALPSGDVVYTETYDQYGNLIIYEWSNSNGSGKTTYSYITFELPQHLAEKVQLQQEAVFEALEYSQIG